jgi:hypothetical protein
MAEKVEVKAMVLCPVEEGTAGHRSFGCLRMTIWELPGNNWRNDGEEQMNVIGWKMK